MNLEELRARLVHDLRWANAAGCKLSYLELRKPFDDFDSVIRNVAKRAYDLGVSDEQVTPLLDLQRPQVHGPACRDLRVTLDGAIALVDLLLVKTGNPKIGRAGATENEPDKPVWDAERGNLSFKGRPLTRVYRNATRLRPVLDAFHPDWPSRIENPLAEHPDTQALNDALSDLNQKLESVGGIHFRGDGAGGAIWEPAPFKNPDSSS